MPRWDFSPTEEEMMSNYCIAHQCTHCGDQRSLDELGRNADIAEASARFWVMHQPKEDARRAYAEREEVARQACLLPLEYDPEAPDAR